MNVMLEPQVQWLTAAPIWNATTQDTMQMQRPALLRFASDTFMQDLAALLQKDPSSLVPYCAQPESFRARPVGEPLSWTPELTQLKLYQPVHGHFYLIAASLVCRMAGLPDRAVNVSQGEKVSFVFRRVTSDGEMAWVTVPKGWQPLSSGQMIAPGEELLPMFPVNLTENQRRRRLFVGLIPTSSRESFHAAPILSPLIPSDDDLKQERDTRLQEVDSRVITPLKALLTLPAQPITDSKAQAAQLAREQEASRFILLDLADFLLIYLPTLWEQIYNGTPPAGGDPGLELYNLLATATVDGTTWRTALHQAWDERSKITGEQPGDPNFTYDLKNTNLNPDSLFAALQGPLSAAPPPATPPSGTPVPPMPKLPPGDGAQYVLRCVYQRPNCGPLQPDLVSKPTESFTIAPFFDFDAPSRPIRISMPVDTSIAGLRKFQKNVSFLLSDKLRQQMECATDLKKAMDGNLACGDTFALGMICSFSIPIITICALIVLMIFLYLLNIIFWWLPFFRICLPIILKSKK